MDRIDLSGPWTIRHDPLSQGMTGRWWETPPSDGWREVTVPGAWQNVLGVEANGVAWYRRNLPPEAATWPAARLRFESVATDATVWVNARRVGRHVGDYLPFEFDISDALMSRPSGPHEVVVRADQVHAPRPPRGVVVENGHITKGFHDVLSLQHAGLWGGVSVRPTVPDTVRVNGVHVDADPATGRVRVTAEFDRAGPKVSARATVTDDSGRVRGGCALAGSPAQPVWSGDFTMSAFRRWSPDSPALYTLTLELQAGRLSETISQRFGFRDVQTGGRDNGRILLNGNPLLVRGVLYWGHEPEHIAPAPTPDQVRREFAMIRSMGFNAVCLCMYYPPEHFFDIADETGMLVWQEHPVWKSRMGPDLTPQYQRLYEEFFRRDRRHASVVIVSGTCEHEAFEPDLGEWWVRTARRMLPRTLAQVQTGFLEWTPPEQTDLYDDHVYDNHGRWVCFVEDMKARIGELPPKPFVMGETIISNGWPDVARLRERFKADRPWFLSRGLDECAALEAEIERRLGNAALVRFIAQAATWGREHRRFQMEVLRTNPSNAGFVTNSIRDVPICRLGILDDAGESRFRPDAFRASIADRALLLAIPGHARALVAGEATTLRVGVSNFSPSAYEGEAHVSINGTPMPAGMIRAGAGEVAWIDVHASLPVDVEGVPRLARVEAHAEGIESNGWDVVALPPIVREDGVSIETDALAYEGEREFEEAGYSSGWGLPCRSWAPLERQTPAWPGAARFRAGDAPPADTVAIATHLSDPLRDWILAGGRCVFMTSRHAGRLASRYINLWGVVPLVVEREGGVVLPGESDAVLAMLPIDLTRRTIRAMPVEEWGVAWKVEPVIRYVHTHDAGVPKLLDAVLAARCGRGLLVPSTLDHSTPAGEWMLSRLVWFAKRSGLPGDDAAEILG